MYAVLVVQLLMRRLGPQCRMPGEAGRFGNGAWAVLQAVLGHEDSDDGDVVVAELTTHRASVQFLVRRASTGLARFASFWLCQRRCWDCLSSWTAWTRSRELSVEMHGRMWSMASYDYRVS